MFNDIPRFFVGTTTFRVEGMTSGQCEQAVTTGIRAIRGVDRVTVDLRLAPSQCRSASRLTGPTSPPRFKCPATR